jgi:hypothetical protein
MHGLSIYIVLESRSMMRMNHKAELLLKKRFSLMVPILSSQVVV